MDDHQGIDVKGVGEDVTAKATYVEREPFSRVEGCSNSAQTPHFLRRYNYLLAVARTF